MNTSGATQSPEAARPLQSVLTSVSTGLAERRARRAARKQLERDLATYTSPSDRDDMNAILARYDDADVADIRRILQQVHAA